MRDSLRAIANVGVGYNNLDLRGADRRAGIVATNTPDVLTETDGRFRLRADDGRRAPRHRGRALAARRPMAGVVAISSCSAPTCTAARWASSAWAGSGRASRGARPASTCAVLYHNRSRAAGGESSASAVRRTSSLDELLAQADHLVLVLPYSTARYTSCHRRRGAGEDEAAPPRWSTSRAAASSTRSRWPMRWHAACLAAAGLDVFEGEPAFNPRLLALATWC